MARRDQYGSYTKNGSVVPNLIINSSRSLAHRSHKFLMMEACRSTFQSLVADVYFMHGVGAGLIINMHDCEVDSSAVLF